MFFSVNLFLSLLIKIIHGQANWANPTSSFFFFCNYGRQDWTQLPGVESSVNVQLSGDPKRYVTGQIYKVSVSVSVEFDAFLVTGIYSGSKNLVPGFGLPPQLQAPTSNGQLCTVLYSTADRRPKKKLSFFWMAPTAEMGCLDFVATATLKNEIIFKDMKIYRICSESESPEEIKDVALAGIYGEGYLFRDDFESATIDPSLWSRKASVKVTGDCEAVLHGFSATFCSSGNSSELSGHHQELVTVPVNTTTAGVMQFGLGRVTCTGTNTTGTQSDVNVTVHYGTLDTNNQCSNFTFLQTFNLPKGKEAFVNIVPLPNSARQNAACFRWSSLDQRDTCWGIDDVIITNAANRPSSLHVDFDPFNASDWLFFPGGSITRSCDGDGYALAFNGTSRKTNWATTRDLLINVQTHGSDILWKPNFTDAAEFNQWDLKRAEVKENCHGKRVIFLFNDDNFSACTPVFNLTTAANFRFRIAYSSEVHCANSTASHNSTRKKETVDPGKLQVWLEADKRYMLYNTLNLARKGTVSVSSIIPNAGQKGSGKFCWRLHGIDPAESKQTSWTVDDIVLLPTMPSTINYTLQYRLISQCNSQTPPADDSFQIIAQYSNDQGRQWSTLNTLCLPPTCSGIHSGVQSIVWSNEVKPWERFTFPLPNAALQGPLRIRFTQKNRSSDNLRWAIDDVHLAACPQGCNGRGFCHKGDVCVCDEGYEGPYCENPLFELPSTLREDFENPGLEDNFYKITGHSVGNLCGPVATGNAAVFNGGGARQIVTHDSNLSEAEVLSFVVSMNEPIQDTCPGPDRSTETIYVHYSCNGGVTWSLIGTVLPDRNNPVRLTSFRLAPHIRTSGCRIKIWQPYHSGKGKDVWAIDDLYVGVGLAEFLQFNSSGNESPFSSQQLRNGFFCNRTDVLLVPLEVAASATGRKLYRNLETLPVRVGPYSMLQMELVVGCSPLDTLNSSLVTEFSVDAGVTWRKLHNSNEQWQYHASELRWWKRLSIPLPSQTWSQSTRFQVRQTNLGPLEEQLALDYFYVGPKCPDLCRNNGRCTVDGCLCDDGYHRENCLPINVSHSGNRVTGGRLVLVHEKEDGDACFVPGGDNFYMDLPGVRFFESGEVPYSPGLSVHFILRLGSCSEPDAEANETGQIELAISWDGGNEWLTLQEYRLPFYAVPTLVRASIPKPLFSAEYKATLKVRLFQAGIQALNNNVWAVSAFQVSTSAAPAPNEWPNDEVPLETNKNLWIVNANEPRGECFSSSSSSSSLKNKCSAAMFKFHRAVTKDVVLQPDQVIQFKLAPQTSVALAEEAGFIHYPLEVDYSPDGGISWTPVSYSHNELLTVLKDNEQQMFLVEPTDEMILKPVLLRWQLQYMMGTSPVHFQLKDLYIGSPCPSFCSGHGRCIQGNCSCDDGFDGIDCSEKNRSITGNFAERFNYKTGNTEDERFNQDKWRFISGGKVIVNRCSADRNSNQILFFAGNQPRIIQTEEINTQDKKFIGFTVGFTRTLLHKIPCAENVKDWHKFAHRSFVTVDYTVNNGLVWNRLKEVSPENGLEQKLQLTLPDNARSPLTMFRWRQSPPFNNSTNGKLYWYLDDIIISLDDNNPSVFEFDIKDAPADSPLLDTWFNVEGVVQQSDSSTSLLKFTGINGSYAESWDLQVFDSTFVQFQLSMNPKNLQESLKDYIVRLEYSKDHGNSWDLLQNECIPNQRCTLYQLPSKYSALDFTNTTRITLQVPESAVSKSTRFRWILDAPDSSLYDMDWTLDEVYVGNSCPWMCSGHGTCHNGFCICQPGFVGIYCVPQEQLATDTREDFETDDVQNVELLSAIFGGRTSDFCGVLVSGKAAVFYTEGLRLFETIDFDLTDPLYVQLTLKSCDTAPSRSSAKNRILLLQYSANGGITWHLIQMIEMPIVQEQKKLSVDISQLADLKTNCTRLRLWQPSHSGVNRDTWAVDSFSVIAASPSLSPSLSINFSALNEAQVSDNGFYWYGGQVSQLCNSENATALVLGGKRGENALYTKDVTVTSDMVLQFEIVIGCDDGSAEKSVKYPVRLEYSSDAGLNWFLLNSPSFSGNVGDLQTINLPTEYYAFTGRKRFIIPLDKPELSKLIRFRWFQNHLSRDDPEVGKWAIQHIYIGPQCPGHCSGRGTCAGEDLTCHCDAGYEGEICDRSQSWRPDQLHVHFDDPNDLHPFTLNGGSISAKCGKNAFGNCLLFPMNDERWIQTHDLNTTQARYVQFHLSYWNADDDKPKNGSAVNQAALLVQYSIDSGMSWNLLEKILPAEERKTIFISIKLPVNSLSEATRFRWWQIGKQDKDKNHWTIDEIFVAGDAATLRTIDEDFTGDDHLHKNFLLVSGALLEPSCNSNETSFHFRKNVAKKFALTKDLYITHGTYIQFELSMNCMHKDYPTCQKMDLEYSLDYGSTWNSLSKACASENSGCKELSSIYALSSDSSPLRGRITIPFPLSDTVARFRWIEMDTYDPTFAWSLHWVYIGDECGDCSGHGRCSRGKCICDEGFQGSFCDTPKNLLSQSMGETFSGSWNAEYWNRISGASVSSVCGKVGTGEALHFYGPCTRVAETSDFNLNETVVIHFHLKAGCGKGKLTGTVLFQYSTNGGIAWTTIATYALADYEQERLVTQRIPANAKVNGVRLRWWQPLFDGLMESDWAIDSVIFDNTLRIDSLPQHHSNEDDMYLSQSPSGDDDDSGERLVIVKKENRTENYFENYAHKIWWRRENIDNSNSYCGTELKNTSLFIGASTAQEDSILETVDISVENLDSAYLSFSIRLGDCKEVKDEDMGTFVRLEVSFDHGATWQLMKVSRLRGQHLGPPQLPSVFTEPNTWIHLKYPLEEFTGRRLVRIRWIQGPSTLKVSWALKDLYMGSYKPLPKTPGQKTLLEDFNSMKLDRSVWDFLYGGRLMIPEHVVGDGSSAVFSSPRLRIIQTRPLDTRSVDNIEFVLYIKLLCDVCDSLTVQGSHVYLECSTDEGAHWQLMNEYRPKDFTVPRNADVLVPKNCRSRRTLLRWWQPLLIDENYTTASSWALDNIFIDPSDHVGQQLGDNFESKLQENQWTFLLNGKITNDNCVQRNGTVILFSSSGIAKESLQQSLTSRRVLIGQNYMAQFKIRVGCNESTCIPNGDEGVRFEYRNELTENRWMLAKPSCLPSDENAAFCQSFIYEQQSSYDPASYSSWTRVNIRLKSTPFPMPWQFRFIKTEADGQSSRPSSLSWALDDVYIGPSCPNQCHGNGDCVNGLCRCDHGYQGASCSPLVTLPAWRGSLLDNFDELPWLSEKIWSQVEGAQPGSGCGSFVPHAHGRQLYFDGCGRRAATTKFIDTSKISRVSFVLRTGTSQSMPSCRIQETVSDVTVANRAILLQYSVNGIDWLFLAAHQQHDFINVRKVTHNVPAITRKSVIQFRWWQPEHGGQGWDQWALDNVEFQV